MKDKALDFLKFRTFITHQIVKFLFWLSTALIVLAVPLVALVTLVNDGFLASVGTFLGSIFVAGLFILLNRIYSELIIVVFGIHDELKAQSDYQTKSSTESAGNE